MIIADILDPSCVIVPLEAANPTGAITELVDALASAGKVTDRDAVLEAILAREHTRSTGIGEGLAVPHGKSRGCPKLSLAVGKPRAAVDFGSKDGRPCEIVFLLASPTDEMGPHIQALARISRIWLTASFRDAARTAHSPEALHQIIVDHQA
jgi:mannitol/fructose-specific phosphotransferase system IIA component (Ntr-type)